MIELRLLGPAQVTVDGELPPRELTWRKHLALLVYLALAPDRRAGRSRLAGLFWGDRPERTARGSLAEALRIIRASSGDGVEDAGADYVRLVDGAVETDLDRFLALVEEGRQEDAAELVAGELAEGLAIPDAWEFEEWLAGQRRTWRSRSEQALVAAAESALDAGAPERAAELAERAVALVPTSEPACRAAMRSLCLRGDRAGALARYAAFSAMVEEELGIAPSEETVALAEQVRLQRSWRRPPESAERARRGAESRRAPLVGRAEALRTLVREWRACQAGSCRVVALHGDPGAGRTRLLQELLERARLDGATTAVVRAVPDDRESGGEVLGALLHAAGLDPGLRGVELTREVDAAVRGRPHVLAVDDAGWADDASLRELRRLASRLSDAPLMLALVGGPGVGSPALDALLRDVGSALPGASVRVDRLGAEALRELIAWALPDYEDEAIDRLARRVAADTAGQALLAVELLHGLAHGLTLEPASTVWPDPGLTLDQTRPGDLPEPLVAAVRVGFRVLGKDAQRVLAATSVLEPPCTLRRLTGATGLDEEALARILDELEWERWLVADARGYDFAIPLVREIVARDLVTAGQRNRWLGAG